MISLQLSCHRFMLLAGMAAMLKIAVKQNYWIDEKICFRP